MAHVQVAEHALVLAALALFASCSPADGASPDQRRGFSSPDAGVPTGSGGVATDATPGTGGTAGATQSPDAAELPASDTGAAGAPSAPDAGSESGSEVTFEWPETEPGTGQCKPGLYEGTFQCTYTDPSGATAPVSGPLSLRMVESVSGEMLEVRDGVLDGTANTFFVFRADIVGKLDCYRGKFDGKLVNGTYSGFLIVNGAFEGPLSSGYDFQSFSLSAGTWQLTIPTTGAGCTGTWSATYTGP